MTWIDWIVAPNRGHPQGLKSRLSKENHGCLWYRGNYTTQLRRDHNKQMQGPCETASIVESKKVFFVAHLLVQTGS